MIKKLIIRTSFCSASKPKYIKDPSTIPPFDRVDLDFVAHKIGNPFSMTKNCAKSPYRWTPLIQRIQQSDEFLQKMRYFQRLIRFEEKHRSELIDTFIFEALKGTEFDYYYDYLCRSSKQQYISHFHSFRCPFHGIIEFLIYNKSHLLKLPIIPIVITSKISSHTQLMKDEEFDMAHLISSAYWALQNMAGIDQSFSTVRAIQTDGNHWKMIELSILISKLYFFSKEKDGNFEKTGVYYSETRFNKIYNDEDVQQQVLGLIRYITSQKVEFKVFSQLAYSLRKNLKARL